MIGQIHRNEPLKLRERPQNSTFFASTADSPDFVKNFTKSACSC